MRSLDPRVCKESACRLWQRLQNAGLIWAWRDSVLYADAQAMRGSRVMNAHMPGDAGEPSPRSIYNARSRSSAFRWRFAGTARAQGPEGALWRSAALLCAPPVLRGAGVAAWQRLPRSEPTAGLPGALRGCCPEGPWQRPCLRGAAAVCCPARAAWVLNIYGPVLRIRQDFRSSLPFLFLFTCSAAARRGTNHFHVCKNNFENGISLSRWGLLFLPCLCTNS